MERAVRKFFELETREQGKPQPIRKKMFSWGVVSTVVILFLGSGVTFMTAATRFHVFIADILFGLAAALFVVKYLTWEDVAQQEPKKRYKYFALAIAGTLLVFLFCLSADHYINRSSAITLTPPPPPQPEFSVSIEYTFFSGAQGDEFSTPFAVAGGSATNCMVSPSQIVFYIRLKNERPTPKMITAYIVRAGGKPFLRLRTDDARVLMLVEFGTYKGGDVSKISRLHQGTGQASYVKVPVKKLDWKHAFPFTPTTLDQQIVGKTIEPSKAVEGFAFFNYPFNGYFLDPTELWIDITDDSGKKTSFPIAMETGDPNADAGARTIAIDNPVDLSKCRIMPPHPESFPVESSPAPITKLSPNLHFGNGNTFGMNLGRAWTRRELPWAAYITWVIPVTNELAAGKAVGQAANIKAQVTFSIEGKRISDGSAPWQDEEFNSIAIPVGETKYIVVAADRVINGQLLGTWFAVTSNSAMQGRSVSFDSKLLPVVTDEQAQRKLERKLEVRLFSDAGKILQTRQYDWRPASGITPVIIGRRQEH